jgi:hypothetical protein
VTFALLRLGPAAAPPKLQHVAHQLPRSLVLAVELGYAVAVFAAAELAAAAAAAVSMVSMVVTVVMVVAEEEEEEEAAAAAEVCEGGGRSLLLSLAVTPLARTTGYLRQ